MFVTLSIILSGTSEVPARGVEAYAEVISEVKDEVVSDFRSYVSADSGEESPEREEIGHVNGDSRIESNNAIPPVANVADRAVAEVEAEVISEPSPEAYEVTAYTSGYESTGKSPGDAGYGITASGAEVSEGHTLACPPSLDFGTVVDIEGVGERVCADRGSAITEGRLDVYMSELEDAVEFGRKTLEVEILN